MQQYAQPGMQMGSEVRFSYTGTGGELFGKLFVGMLLTMLTLGIYTSWFVAKMAEYIASRTTIAPTRHGDVKFTFVGTGGSLFGKTFVGMLLTLITGGIYLPWFLVAMYKYFAENTRAQAADGTQYQVVFDGTGGELFVMNLVGVLLCYITLYIYYPWFACKTKKYWRSHTKILENGQHVGTLDYTAQGGELLGTWFVGALLTAITFGIYLPWFIVKLKKFDQQHTRINWGGRNFGGDFLGQGGELFVINLVGGILSELTLGIYFFWFQTNKMRFDFNNTVFRELPPGT